MKGNDEIYMQRCFQLAKNGMRQVAPNPMVGSVIVHNGTIIGEGFHRKYGSPHAEVFAVQSVKDQSLLEKSTLYVNLEPCSHYGKTPPCADLIIEKKIPEVVVCNIDPNPVIAGNGIRKLEAAGINVRFGILQDEGYHLNRRFFTFINQKRPYIILKWAESKDGLIGKEGETIAISNSLSKVLVHKWRSEEMAIMVGTNTAICDNPQLNVRDYFGPNPIRISIDRNEKIPVHSNLRDNSQETIIYQTNEIKAILSDLHSRKIQSLIVEGGQKLLQSFIEQNLWDEARILSGNKWLNEGIKAPQIKGDLFESLEIGDDRLFILKNPAI